MRTRLFLLMTFALLAAAGTANAQAVTIMKSGGAVAGTSGRFPVGTEITVSGTGFAGITAIGAGDAEIKFYDAGNTFVASAAISTAGWTLNGGAGTVSGTFNCPNMGTGAANATKCTVEITATGGAAATAESAVGSAVPMDPTPISAMMSQPGNAASLGASATILVDDNFPTDSDFNDLEVQFLDNTATWNAVAGAQVTGAWNAGGQTTLTVDLGTVDANNNGYIEELVGTVVNGSVQMRVVITDTGNNETTLGPRTNLTIDTLPPEVTDINTTNTNIVGNVGSDDTDTSTVVLQFNEALNGATVIAANFTSSAGAVSNPVYNAGLMQVTLTLTPAIAANDTPTITASAAVTDLAGNPVDAGNRNATAADDTISPQLQSAFLNTQNDTLVLTFDEPMGSPLAQTFANYTLAQGSGAPGPHMNNVIGGNITAAGAVYTVDLTNGAYVLDEGNTIAPQATVLDAATAPNAAEISPAVAIVLLPTLNSATYDPIAHNLTLTFSKDISRTSLVNNIGDLSIADSAGAGAIALVNSSSNQYAAGNAFVVTGANSNVMVIQLNATLDEQIHQNGATWLPGAFVVQVGAGAMIADTNAATLLQTTGFGVTATNTGSDTTGPSLVSITHRKDLEADFAGKIVDVVFDDYMLSTDLVVGNFNLNANGAPNAGAMPMSVARDNNGTTVRLTFTNAVDLDVLDGTLPANALDVMAINDTASQALMGGAQNNQAITVDAAVDSTIDLVANMPAGAVLNVATTTAAMTGTPIATFRVTDSGATDAYPTIINGNVILNVVNVAGGGIDVDEHQWFISGGSLAAPVAGTPAGGQIQGVDQLVTFNLSGGNAQTIASGTMVDFTISVRFNQVGGPNSVDGSTFRIERVMTDSNVVSAGGSTFAASAADTDAGVFTYDVQATHILPTLTAGNFFGNTGAVTATGAAGPTYVQGTGVVLTGGFDDEMVNVAQGGTATFTYIDENGLVDTGLATVMVVTPTAGAGAATGFLSGNTAAPAAGVVTVPAQTVTAVAQDVTFTVTSTAMPAGVAIAGVSFMNAAAGFDVLPDTDSTITAENVLTTWDATVAPAPQDLARFTLVDAGTADGLATTVTDINLMIVLGGGTHTHADFTYIFSGITGVQVGATNEFTFAGVNWATADNTMTMDTLTVTRGAITESDDLDAMTFTVSVAATTGSLLSNGPITAPLNSSVVGAAGAVAHNAVRAEVVSTVIRFTNEPTAGQDFTLTVDVVPLTIEFVDGNMNRDLGRNGAGASITVGDTLDGAGADAVNDNSFLGNDTGMATNGVLAMSISHDSGTANGDDASPGRLGVAFRAINTDGATHGLITTANTFNLRAADDANSRLTITNEHAQTILGTDTFVDVLELTLQDLGTSDGKTSALSSLTLNMINKVIGTNNATAFDWQLVNGGMTVAGTPAGDSIVFNNVGLALENATSTGTTDGGMNTAIFKIQAKIDSAASDQTAFDGGNFDLEIPNGGAVMLGTGTSLDVGFVPADGFPLVGTGQKDVSILATRYIYGGTDPDGTTVEAGTPIPTFTVTMVDAHGNIDLGAGQINVGVSGGTVASPAGAVSANVANGVVSFTSGDANNMTLAGMAGMVTVTLSSTNSTPAGIAAPADDSDEFTVTVTPKNELTIGAVSTDATATSGDATGDVFTANVTDAGDDDINTSLDTIVFGSVGASAYFDDVTWELYLGGVQVGAADQSLIAANGGVEFTGMTDFIVTDGATVALVLRAIVPSSKLDSDGMGTDTPGTIEGNSWRVQTLAGTSSAVANFGGMNPAAFGVGTAMTFDVTATDMWPVSAAAPGTTASGDIIVHDLATAGNFNTQFAAGVNVNTNVIVGGMPLRFRWVDANGNIDRDGTESVDVTFNGSAVGIAGNGGGASVAAVNGEATITSLSFANSALGQPLVFSDDAGGIGLAAGTDVTVPHFDVYEVQDSNSTLTSRSDPANVNISSASAVEFWSFDINEIVGATDNRHTEISGIRMQAISDQGGIDTTDFTWSVTIGGATVAGVTATPAGNFVTLSFPANAPSQHVQADSGVNPTATTVDRLAAGNATAKDSAIVRIFIKGNTSAMNPAASNQDVVDGMMFTMVQLDNITYHNNGTTSTIGTALPFAKPTPAVTLDVTADRLALVSVAPALGATWQVGYSQMHTFEVEMTDEYGYRQLDQADHVAVTRADGGTFWNDADPAPVVTANSRESTFDTNITPANTTATTNGMGLVTFPNLILSTDATGMNTNLVFTKQGGAFVGALNMVSSSTFMPIVPTGLPAVSTTSGPSFVAASVASSSVAIQDMYTFTISDADGDNYTTDDSDTLDTVLKSIEFDVSNSTASLHDGTWALMTAGEADVIGVLDSVSPAAASTLTFTYGSSVTILNDQTRAFTVRFTPSGVSRISLDNSNFNLRLTASSYTLLAGAVTNGTTSNIQNPNIDLTDIPYQVVSDRIAFNDSLAAAAGFPPVEDRDGDMDMDDYVIRFVDAYGTVDTDRAAGNTVTLTWSGAGAVTNGVKVAAAGTASFNDTWVAAPGLLGGTLTWTPSTGAHAPIMRNFDLNGNPDQDSTFTTVANVATIDSDAVGRTTIWTLDVRDLGTSDLWDTEITDVVIGLGTMGGAGNDLRAFDFWLNGVAGTVDHIGLTVTFAGLTIDVTDMATSTTDDATGAITAVGAAVISNPAGVELTLEMMLDQAWIDASGDENTVDNMIVNNIQINSATGPAMKSEINPASLPFVKGMDVTVDVVATQVNTEDGAMIANQVGGAAFAVSVEYNDTNGNRDTDVAGDMAVAARNDGNNTVTNAFSNAAVSGVALFPNIILGYPAFEAGALTFDDGAAGPSITFNNAVAANNFNLLADDELTVTAGANAEVATLSSITTAETLVLDFNLNDVGTDTMQADIKSLTFDLTGTTLNVAQGTFILEGPGFAAISKNLNEGDTSVTFDFDVFGGVSPTLDPLTVPNSANVTIELKFEPHVVGGTPGLNTAANKNLAADGGATTPTKDGDQLRVELQGNTHIVYHFGQNVAGGVPSASILSGSEDNNGGAGSDQFTSTYEVVSTALTILQQPQNGMAGAAFATVANPVRVQRIDVHGNVDINGPGTVDISAVDRGGMAVVPANTAFSAGTTSQADGNNDGIFVFDDLQIDVAEDYTMTFSNPGSIVTASFTIDHGPADHFTIDNHPTPPAFKHVAGTGLNSIDLQLEDAFGNDVDEMHAVTVAILNDASTMNDAVLSRAGGLTLSSAGASGAVSFTGLSIQRAADGYTLRFSTPTLPMATQTVDTNAFDIRHAAASQMRIGTQPAAAANIVAGTSFDATAQVEDQFGNPTILGPEVMVTVDTAPIANRLTSPASLTKLTSMGLVEFDGVDALDIELVGTYNLAFTSGVLTTANAANTFTIVHDVPASVEVTAQPGAGANVVAGTNIPYTVQMRDQYTNLVTNPAGMGVDVTVAATPANFAMGSVDIVTATAATNGVANFTAISIEQAGTYRLRASINGGAIQSPLIPVMNAFNVVAANADHFTITSGPAAGPHEAGQPEIETVLQLRDQYGNPKMEANHTATATIGNDGSDNGPASLVVGNSLSLTTNGMGVVSFTGAGAALAIDKVGSGYTLTFTGMLAGGGAFPDANGGMDPVTTVTNFAIEHTDPSKFVIAMGGNPAAQHTAGVGSISITANLLDQYDNPVIRPGSQVFTSVDTITPAGLITSGTTSANSAGGTAFFNNLVIENANDSAANMYQLRVSTMVAGVASADSTAFNVEPAAVDDLVFVQQPGNGTGGIAINPQPVLELQDAFDNTCWNDSTSVIDASINKNEGLDDGGTALAGTLTGMSPTAVAGVATFTDLTIDKRGTGYTLDFQVNGMAAVDSDESATFDITVGPVAALEMVTQPDGLKAGRVLTTQPAVRGRDLGGNLVEAMTYGVRTSIASALRDPSLAPVTNPTISGQGTLGGAPNAIDTVVMTGVATFTDLQIDVPVGSELPGDFTLEFSVPSVPAATSVISASFKLILGTILERTTLDDHDKDQTISDNDEVYFFFDEAVLSAPDSAQLDAAFGLSGGATFGVGATAVLADDPDNPVVNDNTVVVVRLGTGSTINFMTTTSDPSINGIITDVNGNSDVTPMPVAFSGHTTDVYAPGITSLSVTPTTATLGDTITIVVEYDDTQDTARDLMVTRPDASMVMWTPAEAAGGRVYTYTNIVQPHDGIMNLDGDYTFMIEGDGNSFMPVMYPFDPTIGTAKGFNIDTRTPAFDSISLLRNGNAASVFTNGDLMHIDVVLAAEDIMVNAASVTADLSSIGNGAVVGLTHNGGNSYSTDVFVGAVANDSAFTVLTFTATDLAGNSAMTTVAIALDVTAPQPVLSYGRPADMLTPGTHTITATFFEDVTTPTITIAGITDAKTEVMAEAAGGSSRIFMVDVVIDAADVAGTGTVTFNGSSTDQVDLQVTDPNPNTFMVVAGPVALSANAGDNQTLTHLRQVTLSSAGSLGANTYEWTVTNPDNVDVTGGLLADNTLSVVNMMPTLPGVYTVRLRVTGVAGEATDYMTVTVPNFEPSIVVDELITISSTEVVADTNDANLFMANLTLNASIFDANNEAPERVTWVNGANDGNVTIKPSTVNSQNAELSVAGAEMMGGVYTFHVDVYDREGLLNDTPVRKTVTLRVVSGTVVPPTAVAFSTREVMDLPTAMNSGVMLNGSNSIDPNSNTAMTYAWSISNQSPAGGFDNSSAVNPVFTPMEIGVYEITLTVTDAEMLSDSDTLRVIVIEGNDGNAGTKDNSFPITEVAVSHMDNEDPANEMVNVNEEVTLDASATVDTDGDALTFLYTQLSGPQVMLTDPTTSIQTFTPTAAGTYTFWVRARDADGRGIGKRVSVTVASAGNDTINASATLAVGDRSSLEDLTVAIYGGGVDGDNSNTEINLDASQSSSDAGIASYFWTQLQAGGPVARLSGVQTASARFWPVDDMGNVILGTYSFALTVIDNDGSIAIDVIHVAVQTFDADNNPNGDSVPAAIAGDSFGVDTIAGTAGRAVGLTGSNSADADNDALTYTWTQVSGPMVILDLTDPANPTFVAPQAGNYVFELVASDADGNVSAPDRVVVNVVNPSKGGGGDSCSLNAINGGFGGMALLLMVLASIVVVRRRRVEA